MIDLNYLNEFPKSFNKETSQMRSLLSIYNEMRAEVTYVKSAIEIEVKSQENASKSVNLATKAFSVDSSCEDLTNFAKIQSLFSALFDNLFTESQSGTLLSIVNKTFTEISDDIGDFTKGNSENVSALIRDLNNSRSKYKLLLAKTEKSYKELDQTFIAKKKNESDDKNSYNLTIKEKIDERILTILNEFEENKAALNSTFDECKKLEVVLNELIKNSFVNTLKFLVTSINSFKTGLESITKEKKNKIHKCRTEFLAGTICAISNIKFELDSQELRYNDTRGIKNEFAHLVYLFENENCVKVNNDLNTSNTSNTSEKEINQNQNLNSINPTLTWELNIEDYFNKTNYSTSPFVDNLLSFVYSFLQTITIRKKQFSAFNKYLNELIKTLENFCSLTSKLTKNLSIPKVVILQNCPFIIQIQEFLRNLIEIEIRKEEEFTKVLVSSLQSPLEHSVVKDITSDETIASGIFNKIQKEYNSFKANLAKLQLNKEKVTQNLEKVKENIQKTSDDVNSFTKFEKQFLSLRTEEGNLNEACTETYKKFRKFLEESIEILRKTIISYKEKENNKLKEFKEGLVNTIKLRDKNFNQINEFLEFCSQISIDDTAILKSILDIYSNFSEKFEINLNENLLKEIFSNVINDKKEIPNLLQDTLFLNKEETVTNKEFHLEDIITNEDLTSYKEKLNYLKTNSKRISIRNVNLNKKMHEEIFYLDEDENVVGSFSCALSDKILLQGKLYVTNKKLVFYSWFNNSTLFGKTLIEIRREEILDVDRHKNLLFDNMIFVKTKTTHFLFASMINREKCYYLVREIYFNEINPIKNPNAIVDKNEGEGINIGTTASSVNAVGVGGSNLNTSEDNIIINENKLSLKEEEIKIKSKSERTSPIINLIKQEEDIPVLNKRSTITEEVEEIKLDQPVEDWSAIDLITKTRMELFNSNNKRNFLSVLVKNYKFEDVPLSYIFQLYDPDVIFPELGKNKNFVLSYLEERKDFGFKLNKIEEESWTCKTPKYIKNRNSLTEAYQSKNLWKSFLEELQSAGKEYTTIEYKYFYTHPILKKKFMGPSKLEIEDVYTVYFVSPQCMIVEIFSYMSGFMMMDTFYSVGQYKFETSAKFSKVENRLVYDTTMTISFGIEFVKDNWFKSKILAESQSDMEEFTKNIMLPYLNKTIAVQKAKYIKEVGNYDVPYPDRDRDRDRVLSTTTSNIVTDQLPKSEIEKVEIKLEKEKGPQTQIKQENNISNLDNSNQVNFPSTIQIDYLTSLIKGSYIQIFVAFIFVVSLLLLLPLEKSSIVILVLCLFVILMRKLSNIENKINSIQMEIAHRK